MKRDLVSVYLSVALASGLSVTAAAQSASARPPMSHLVSAGEGRLADRVHISPTTMQADAIALEKGSDTWTARGYELKALIAEIYDVDVRQVDLADSSDKGGRYDLSVTLPREMGPEELQRLLADAVEQKFGIDIKPEVRSMYVYAVMAPNGPGSSLRPHPAARSQSGDDAGEIRYAGRGCSGVAAEGVSVTDKTIADFTRTLQPDMDRLLIDETKLSGTYDFEIGKYTGQDELFRLLREQLGLVVKPVERKVTVLRVRPHGEFSF